jgi:hypothetical protein
MAIDDDGTTELPAGWRGVAGAELPFEGRSGNGDMDLSASAHAQTPQFKGGHESSGHVPEVRIIQFNET